MDKSRLSKTITTKVNNANKALEILKEALTDQYVDKHKIQDSVLFIKKYIHTEELKALELTAERFEFKGNLKKALDSYQDVLFFLKKDEIDDAQQKTDLNRIENKIEQLKANLSK